MGRRDTMNVRHYTFGVALLAVLFLVGMVGCYDELGPVKFTGGGTIPSAETNCLDGEKANFGFFLNNCGEAVKGNLTYHDKYYGIKTYRCDDFDDKFETQAKNLGVKLQGEFTGMVYSGITGDFALFTYESKNPFCKGVGDGKIWVVDEGEGANADDDLLCIHINSGPFRNYTNCGRFWSGEVVQGNIQEHECKPGDLS